MVLQRGKKKRSKVVSERVEKEVEEDETV